ncbi:MAG: hypothetical protein KIT22_18730, partial [Verrucomicrobiae bacterium]|nr:hypothetical protein [Verrucomicrobiae bacterium]
LSDRSFVTYCVPENYSLTKPHSALSLRKTMDVLSPLPAKSCDASGFPMATSHINLVATP